MALAPSSPNLSQHGALSIQKLCSDRLAAWEAGAPASHADVPTCRRAHLPTCPPALVPTCRCAHLPLRSPIAACALLPPMQNHRFRSNCHAKPTFSLEPSCKNNVSARKVKQTKIFRSNCLQNLRRPLGRPPGVQDGLRRGLLAPTLASG